MDGGRRRPFTMRPDDFSWEDGDEGLLLEKSELVPSSLAPIVPILRAANEIEEENLRVAPRPLQIERRRAVRRADLCRRRRIHRGSGRWPWAGGRRSRPGGSGHGGHDISTLPGLDIFVTMADGYNDGNSKDGEPRATWMANGTQWVGTWVEPTEDHRKGSAPAWSCCQDGTKEQLHCNAHSHMDFLKEQEMSTMNQRSISELYCWMLMENRR